MVLHHPLLGICGDTSVKRTGKCAVGYHKRSYMRIHETYEKIKAYLNVERYSVCSDSSEECLFNLINF